jgi:hypothetical protein
MYASRRAAMKKPITLALGPDVRAALDHLAEKEDRSRSWLADRALREWLATRPTLGGTEPHRAAQHKEPRA